MGLVIAAVAALLAGALAYWLLVTTEGTYFGSGFVALLYDWTARRYDEIKAVRYIDEALFIGVPLMQALAPVSMPRVLDIATGTARVPLALLKHQSWGARRSEGLIVGLDRSRGMLAQARQVLDAQGVAVSLVLGDGDALAFAGASFDAVTCLEALEFMTSGEQVIDEIVRVLRPGGTVLLSNRVGVEASVFPGRMAGRGRLEEALRQAGLMGVRSQRWQVHYDLIWAFKPERSGRETGSPSHEEHRHEA